MGAPESLHDVLASNPLLLTPEEAATVLRIGRTTICALMKAGELPPLHIGRSCRLSRAELEGYVNRLQAPPPPPATRTHPRRRRATTNQGGLFDHVHTPAGCRLTYGFSITGDGRLSDTRHPVRGDGGATVSPRTPRSSAKRRGNSEGSTPRRRPDGRWQINRRVTDEFGQSGRHTVYGEPPQEARTGVRNPKKG